MTRGCSMSGKQCYSCIEHEMRPLPAGKLGKNVKKKNTQGAFRLLAMTGETLQITFVVIWEREPDGCTRIYSTWLRWTVLPGSPESWKSVLCLSLLLINIFHQVRVWGGDGVRMKGEEGSPKGRKEGGGWRGGGGDWPVKAFRLKTWPLDFKLLLPTGAFLSFSRHAQQSRNLWPCSRFPITHLCMKENRGTDKRGNAGGLTKTHTLWSAKHMAQRSSREWEIASTLQKIPAPGIIRCLSYNCLFFRAVWAEIYILFFFAKCFHSVSFLWFSLEAPLPLFF